MQDFEAGVVLVPYEFDAAVLLYGDIPSVIAHHDRSKSKRSPHLRSLYDLRSGVILGTASTVLKVMSDHASATQLSPEKYRSLQVFRQALGGLDPVNDALRYLDSALAENPTLGEALYHKGTLLAALGRRDEAISLFRRAIGLMPSIIPLPQDVPLECRVLFECAKLLDERGDDDQAIDWYRRAVELAPCFPEAQRRYARCLQRAGRWDAAAKPYHYAMVNWTISLTLPALPAAPAAANARQLHAPQFLTDLDHGPRRDSGFVFDRYNGFDLIWAAGTYHAIHWMDGVFDIRQAQAGKYARWFSADSADQLRSQIDELPRKADGAGGFNIVRAGRKHQANPPGQGDIDIRHVRGGRHGHWFSGSAARQAAPDDDEPPALVVEGYCGFNIIAAGGRFHAIPQSEGEFSLRRARNGQYAGWLSDELLANLWPRIQASPYARKGRLDIVAALARFRRRMSMRAVLSSAPDPRAVNKRPDADLSPP
jgi:Tetratricopeptide repeat